MAAQDKCSIFFGPEWLQYIFSNQLLLRPSKVMAFYILLTSNWKQTYLSGLIGLDLPVRHPQLRVLYLQKFDEKCYVCRRWRTSSPFIINIYASLSARTSTNRGSKCCQCNCECRCESHFIVKSKIILFNRKNIILFKFLILFL